MVTEFKFLNSNPVLGTLNIRCRGYNRDLKREHKFYNYPCASSKSLRRALKGVSHVQVVPKQGFWVSGLLREAPVSCISISLWRCAHPFWGSDPASTLRNHNLPLIVITSHQYARSLTRGGWGGGVSYQRSGSALWISPQPYAGLGQNGSLNQKAHRVKQALFLWSTLKPITFLSPQGLGFRV